MKKLFIGIDFSKKTVDVSVIDVENLQQVAGYQQFENDKEGCKSMLKRVKGLGHVPKGEWLFCGEHTGLYSVLAGEFLQKNGLFFRMENPLQIKQSTGVKRDKNDRIDSRDIALYAARFQDRARNYHLPAKVLKPLELLLSFRERLLRNKHTLSVSSAEVCRIFQRDVTARYIYGQSRRDIERIGKEIKEIETKMQALMQESEAVRENCERVSSIKGIALINTVAIIVATQNFIRFENSRRFACY
jgi:transposase